MYSTWLSRFLDHYHHLVKESISWMNILRLRYMRSSFSNKESRTCYLSKVTLLIMIRILMSGSFTNPMIACNYLIASKAFFGKFRSIQITLSRITKYSTQHFMKSCQPSTKRRTWLSWFTAFVFCCKKLRMLADSTAIWELRILL